MKIENRVMIIAYCAMMLIVFGLLTLISKSIVSSEFANKVAQIEMIKSSMEAVSILEKGAIENKRKEDLINKKLNLIKKLNDEIDNYNKTANGVLGILKGDNPQFLNKYGGD